MEPRGDYGPLNEVLDRRGSAGEYAYSVTDIERTLPMVLLLGPGRDEPAHWTPDARLLLARFEKRLGVRLDQVSPEDFFPLADRQFRLEPPNLGLMEALVSFVNGSDERSARSQRDARRLLGTQTRGHAQDDTGVPLWKILQRT